MAEHTSLVDLKHTRVFRNNREKEADSENKTKGRKCLWCVYEAFFQSQLGQGQGWEVHLVNNSRDSKKLIWNSG